MSIREPDNLPDNEMENSIFPSILVVDHEVNIRTELAIPNLATLYSIACGQESGDLCYKYAYVLDDLMSEFPIIRDYIGLLVLGNVIVLDDNLETHFRYTQFMETFHARIESADLN